MDIKNSHEHHQQTAESKNKNIQLTAYLPESTDKPNKES